MAVEVKIPPMGESITGGLLAAWLVKSGYAVRKGCPSYTSDAAHVLSGSNYVMSAHLHPLNFHQ